MPEVGYSIELQGLVLIYWIVKYGPFVPTKNVPKILVIPD